MRGALRTGAGLAIVGFVAAFLPSAAEAACTPAPSRAAEAKLTKLIAADRKAARAGKVAKDPVLVRAGRKKSLQMARGGKFAHSEGMAWAKGRAGAQNLAMAPSPQLAMRAMLASPPHRSNLRSRAWRVTGVGAAKDCDGQIFFTVNFAGPPS